MKVRDVFLVVHVEDRVGMARHSRQSECATFVEGGIDGIGGFGISDGDVDADFSERPELREVVTLAYAVWTRVKIVDSPYSRILHLDPPATFPTARSSTRVGFRCRARRCASPRRITER